MEMEKNGKIPVIVKFIFFKRHTIKLPHEDLQCSYKGLSCCYAGRSHPTPKPPPVKGGGSLKRGERVGGSV